ncbi:MULTISPECIES: hypothetical protein [unclassified Endozoicomonas]|uniref:hypothetical protein n=1 Tax=unclassified Endozoicomonas TaxID=2644528 RepID=UPI003BB0E2A6
MYRHFFFWLLVIYLQDVRAVEDLRVFFVVEPSNLKFLMDGCYQFNTEFSYSIEDVKDENKGSRKAVVVFMKHLKNPFSCFLVPSREFGVFAEGSDDYKFYLHYFDFGDDEPGFTQYFITKSFWYHLFYTSFIEQKNRESKFAESFVSKISDLEVVLLFKCFGDEESRNDCKDYLLESLEWFGWNIETKDRRKDGFIYIRIIIPLGNEHHNNSQTFQLDSNVRLDIEKSGVRRKGERNKGSMIFFPSLVCQKKSCETLALSSVQNQEDYCAFGMIGSNNACVWTFPRSYNQLETFVEESPGTGTNVTAKAKNIYEACREYTKTSADVFSITKALFVALTGIVNSFKRVKSDGSNSLENTSKYLNELGFEVHNMPTDGYCGWHAILSWIRNNRYELLSEMTENPDELTASGVFEYFSARAQERVDEGDEPDFVVSMANEMNGSHSDRMWLEDNHIRYLIAPFINQNILMFDIASNAPTSGCPFQISLITPDGVDINFQNQNEIVEALHENRHCMMLLHASNHWLLVMPADQVARTQANQGNTTSQDLPGGWLEIDWSKVVVPQSLSE